MFEPIQNPNADASVELFTYDSEWSLVVVARARHQEDHLPGG